MTKDDSMAFSNYALSLLNVVGGYSIITAYMPKLNYSSICSIFWHIMKLSPTRLVLIYEPWKRRERIEVRVWSSQFLWTINFFDLGGAMIGNFHDGDWIIWRQSINSRPLEINFHGCQLNLCDPITNMSHLSRSLIYPCMEVVLRKWGFCNFYTEKRVE